MGQIPKRSNILAISNAFPCEVTIDINPGYITGDFVRLSNLNGAMPIPHGSDPLNNYRWQIVLTSDTTFNLKYPITHEYVDSTNFTPYVTGGFCNLIDRNFIYYNDEDNNG